MGFLIDSDIVVFETRYPLNFWNEFKDIIGKKAMKKYYGKHWPRQPANDEHIFVFLKIDNGKIADKYIGWVAVRPDPVDPIAWYATGIWPKYQGKGYVKLISEWAIDYAFKTWDVKMVCIHVMKSNKEWLNKKVKLTEMTYWKCIGEMNIPDLESVIFGVSEEDWKRGDIK